MQSERNDSLQPPRWRLDEVVGRLVELVPATEGQAAGSAVRTASVSLLRDAQLRGEPVAWIVPAGSSFHPPDVAAHGVDLEALAVIRTTTPVQAWRAADELLRSGSFGLVVLEPEPGAVLPAMAVQVRLANLARQHDAALLWCVTEGGEARTSGVATASLRVVASRRRVEPAAAGRPSPTEAFVCRLQARKDRRRGRGWSLEFSCDGPPGLR